MGAALAIGESTPPAARPWHAKPQQSHSIKRQLSKLRRPLRKRPARSPSYFKRLAKRQQQRAEQQQQQQQQAEQQRPIASRRLSAARPALLRLTELFAFTFILALALVMHSRNI